MRQIVIIMSIIVQLQIINAFITVQCEERYNMSSWSCQEYENRLANNKGENLPETISCTDYDPFQSPSRQLKLDDPTIVYVTMKVLKVHRFDIETSVRIYLLGQKHFVDNYAMK